jgi:hypothetical protein
MKNVGINPQGDGRVSMTEADRQPHEPAPLREQQDRRVDVTQVVQPSMRQRD